MFEHVTTDARAVIVRVQHLAIAVGRRHMTLWDLAAALSTPSGNSAALWHNPATETSPAVQPMGAGSGTAGTGPPVRVSTSGPSLRFDPETRAMLEEALRVALRERAGHIGTEHLLAAMVRTAPPDVVDWLAARGATAEAVDALLTQLRGGPGVERLPAGLARAHRRIWRRATGRANGRPVRGLLTTAAVVLTIVVVFVLCIWGP